MQLSNENILIIDNRKELSTKYKRLIEQELCSGVEIKNSTSALFDYIKNYEPDLIIISDSIENVTEIQTQEVCNQIRTRVKSYRPVVIVLSKSSHLDDKLKNLNAGCDDFMSEPIENEEFIARINAHLRRNSEQEQNSLTSLPTNNITIKVLKRALASGCKWSVLFTSIDYFAQYKQIYGELAAEKLIQTYAAIIQTTLDENDYIGHFDTSNFFIITIPEKADRIAKTLIYAFDKVSSRFYTKEDSEKGYIAMYSDETIGRRVPLVSTSIGIVDNVNCAYTNYKDVLSRLFATQKLAHTQSDSAYIKDVPQICGISAVQESRPDKVLVVEKDAALAYLVTSTLEMQGSETLAISNYNEVQHNINEFKPDVIIMDAGYENTLQGIDICKEIKLTPSTIKIIVSSIFHDKEVVLNAGADLYLPKPYDIVTLHSWVRRFLDE